MKNRIIAFIALCMLLSLPSALFADQILGGLGFPIFPGEPKYDSDRFLINVSFEMEDQWRFSFTDSDFDHKDDSATEIRTQVFGGEKLWFHTIKENLALVGGVGVGLYSVDTEPGSSGFGFGLMATGSARFAITEQIFIDAAIHYRNAAVKVGSDSVNGGYQGLVVSGGFKF